MNFYDFLYVLLLPSFISCFSPLLRPQLQVHIYNILFGQSGDIRAIYKFRALFMEVKVKGKLFNII